VLRLSAKHEEHDVAGTLQIQIRRQRPQHGERRDGVAKLGKVADGRGRKTVLPKEKIDEIVDLTHNSTPAGETHWSVRTMAKKVGVSPATVQRIWAARGLKPHLVKTFKLSTDPKFEEKLIDVVGLYLDPPEKSIVLCMDEKSSVQALDRTQASLPMVKGYLDAHNDHPKPFVWTAKAEDILAKVQRGRVASKQSIKTETLH